MYVLKEPSTLMVNFSLANLLASSLYRSLYMSLIHAEPVEFVFPSLHIHFQTYKYVGRFVEPVELGLCSLHIHFLPYRYLDAPKCTFIRVQFS